MIPKLKDIKNWSPEIEKQITDDWKKLELYNFNAKTKKKIYSIDTPPPYINTPIHMGHAVTYSFMDMIARFRRMLGYEVIFPLGLDKNGLPIEMGAEKKYKISPFDVGREKFIELCEKMLAETTAESIDSFVKLGISFSSYKESDNIGAVYNTDSAEYRSLTQSTFIDLYKKGLVYEDTRINNWDPELQTTIADSEIDYIDKPSTFNDIKWKIKETGEEIIIGTTRPELICTCGMVIFNPEDARYKHLEGKTAITPLFDKEVKIKSHPLAQIDKGTGIVMMCSAGDLSDIQFFREQNLKPVIAINKDGTMNKHSGFLQGLKVRKAREAIIEKLKKEKLIVKQQQIMHRTPISERSKAEVEFIEMPEFYLKQLEFKDDLRRIADKVNFYPPESKKILLDWIDAVSIDWPISRRRYYATEVPLWHSEDNSLIAIPKQGKYYRPWKQQPENAEIIDAKTKKIIGTTKDSKFKNIKWIGEIRVFDTWMDSSISELYIIKYKSNQEFFKKAYPVSLRPQGKEIVRTWLYYTLLRGFLETKKPCFQDCWIHQHILDEKGRKMSKSLGNVIDPKELLTNYGGDALRLWSATEGDLSKTDFVCSREKIQAELKTINKLLNISRFILQFEKSKKPAKLFELDKLLINYIDYLSDFAKENYQKYDFYHPALKLREFLWEIFASHYLELVKNRVYNHENNFSKQESDSAKYTLYYLLERLLILLHPIIPQSTYIIANSLDFDLLKYEWPKSKKFQDVESVLRQIMQFNSNIWKQKKDSGISLREPIKGKVPKELSDFKEDLIATHKLE